MLIFYEDRYYFDKIRLRRPFIYIIIVLEKIFRFYYFFIRLYTKKNSNNLTFLDFILFKLKNIFKWT